MGHTRRPSRKALKLTAIGLLLPVIAGGAATSAWSARGGRGVEVIRAVRTTEDRAAVDLGTAGASLGDQVVFTARFDVDGQRIGFDGGVCTLVQLPQVYQCVATNSLPKGQLTAQGLVDFNASGPANFAITGGTQRYQTARGSVEVVFGADNDQVTFRIITGPGRRT
jgi:Allene oxide cyclase barrel like domain